MRAPSWGSKQETALLVPYRYLLLDVINFGGIADI